MSAIDKQREIKTNSDASQSPPATLEEPYTIFDKRQKVIIVLTVAVAASFSGFASNIYFPSLPAIARDLDVSIEAVNLTVTSYLIFQGIAPSFWGPISDVKGRRIAYCCTFVVFLGACVGLALTKNYATLIVLRCLQSTGSASTIAIGSGVIGDITTRTDRGGYMGIFQTGLLVPVAVGPVIGGALASSLGWRAIFWFLVIFSGIFLFLLVLFLPETLRSVVSNGGRTPSNLFGKYPLTVFQRMTKVRWNPEMESAHRSQRKPIDVTGSFRIVITKHATFIIFFLAIHYTVWQMSITAMSTLFEQGYHLKESSIGLTFIANGVGSMIGTLSTGKILDIDYRRLKKKHEVQIMEREVGLGDEQTPFVTFPPEETRLRFAPIFSLVQSMSILLFGWSIQYPSQVHIAVPIVSTFFTGWTAVSTQSIVMTYLVDIFPDRSASASASLNLARCLFAAGGTSFIMPLIDAVGVGSTFSICTGIQVIALLGVAVQWKYGARWRRDGDQR